MSRCRRPWQSKLASLVSIFLNDSSLFRPYLQKHGQFVHYKLNVSSYTPNSEAHDIDGCEAQAEDLGQENSIVVTCDMSQEDLSGLLSDHDTPSFRAVLTVCTVEGRLWCTKLL